MRELTRHGLSLAALALAAAPLGCVGDLGSGPAAPEGFECVGGACVELAASSSRFPRLSEEQWENTVRDLLRLETRSGLTATFPPDAPSGLFDNNGAELSVSGDLRLEYQRAAERLAEQVTSDTAALMRILPSGLPASGEARVQGFVERFGARVYRRTLSSSEVATYTALFARGTELYPDLDPFVAGVRLSLEAMLQSPHFVYRAELAPHVDGAPSTMLTAHELASRLSYALWGTMPDDDLFEAAASGALDSSEGLGVEVDRMLEDPRAEDMLVRYHEQLLSVRTYGDLSRSSTLFPAFSPEARTAMGDEVRLFVRDVFEEGGGVRELLTARYTYANEALAEIYGLDGVSGPEMRRVSLEGSRRGGLLTMPGFLAANSSSTESDPIHRGVFVNHRILCAPLPAPPMLVEPLPAEDPSMPRTMRQRVTLHTGPGTCGASCHATMINPIGFAFEQFDAVGAFRERDRNGLEIDAADAYAFRGQVRSYEDALELSAILAEQRMTHSCYAEHLLQFVHGRAPAQSDEVLLRRLTRASLNDSTSLRGLVRVLVTSETFRQRSTRELDELPSLEME